MIKTIEEAWGWIGIRPSEVIGENEFGNLIIKDERGAYWRLCPEDLACQVIANNRAEFDQLSSDQDFLDDWHVGPWVAMARRKLGPLPEGRKYCLKIPSVLGGAYDESNFATIGLVEMVSYSGELARQIENLPDGAQVEIKIVE